MMPPFRRDIHPAKPIPTNPRFRDLPIGDEFDFVDHSRLINSFTSRCRKISARRYEWADNIFPKTRVLRSEVGTINVRVYNVTRLDPANP